MAYSPDQIDTIARANREAEHAARNQTEAFAVAKAAAALADALYYTGGKYGDREMHRLLELCNAMIEMVDDGDCMAERDNLMTELRCDEHGNPVPAESDMVRWPTGAEITTLANRSFPA